MDRERRRKTRKLIVIIPALNEQHSVVSVITGIPRQMDGIDAVEVLVVDDGSTDQTAFMAQASGATVVRHQQTLGVGAAFHTGMRQALYRGADLIVNIDADGQFDPGDIPTLIEPIVKGVADFVTTTRFARKDFMPDMPFLKIWGNRWMVRIINLITGKHFTDVSCGFRAYSREAALRMTLFGRFTYTQETFIDLAFKDVAMAEVPLRVRGQRQHGRSRVADNLWRYGVKTASIIFRTARDYMPIHFFGIPGAVISLLGLAGGIFLLVHWLRTGQTYPYRSLVQLSGVLIIVGVMLGFIAMLADMQHRNRILVERILYMARKQEYGDIAHKPEATGAPQLSATKQKVLVP